MDQELMMKEGRYYYTVSIIHNTQKYIIIMIIKTIGCQVSLRSIGFIPWAYLPS